MTDPRDLVARLAKERKLSLKALSLMIERNDTYLQQFVSYGKPKKLDEVIRVKLSKILGAPPEDFLPDDVREELEQGAEPVQKGQHRSSYLAANLERRREAALPHTADMARDVPVYGVVVGGVDGDFRLDHEAVGYVRRPPGVMFARMVFAFYVSNDSMEPAHRHGALIYCDPARPVRIGDDVVIELPPKADGEPSGCLLKRLVRRTADKIVVRQFNPDKEITIPTGQYVRLIRVLTLEEVLGV